MKNIIFFSLVVTTLCLSGTALAQRKYLFKWDEGSGHIMPGWTWTNDIAYGHPGWINDTAWPHEPGNNQQGYSISIFEKNDSYGSDATTSSDVAIITNDRAPSTSSGGALKVYDDGGSSHYRAQWWLWYDGVYLGDTRYRNVTTANTDRWSFYVKLTADDYMSGEGGGSNSTGLGTFCHMGIYLCDDNQGDGGCPYEGPLNQHYYFYMFYQPDIWIHTLLDRHPQHKRGVFVAGNDPAWIKPTVVNNHSYQMHLFEHMHQFYFVLANEQQNPSAFTLDDMYFYSTQDASEEVEPNQNDESVTSLWVGFEPTTGYWYMGWMDESYEDENGENTNDNTNSTFEIRWSTSPITNANYNSANIVSPDWFSGPEHTSYPNGVRRQSSWSVRAWTRFDLPTGVEDSNNKIYFAVKDVSVNGGNAGTQWPWNKTDGHDAASPYIKTIDYNIRPDNMVGPNLSNSSPTGEQPAGTTQVTMSLTTDVNATCKYGNDGITGVTYANLPNTFTTTGGTNHSVTISGLTDGNSYSRAVRCTDGTTENDTDYIISWSVASSSTVIRADVDQNSAINTVDALLTLRNSLGLDMSGTNWHSSSTTGDVNCDSSSNSTDAMLILRHSLGLSDGAGWCEN